MPFLSGEKTQRKGALEKPLYSKIGTQLKKNIKIDPTYIELGRLSDRTGIAKNLETRNATYHKICYDKIGQKEYNRLLARVGKKPCSGANLSSSSVISHKRAKTELRTELCNFC